MELSFLVLDTGENLGLQLNITSPVGRLQESPLFNLEKSTVQY
jgi:hypothetical protein